MTSHIIDLQRQKKALENQLHAIEQQLQEQTQKSISSSTTTESKSGSSSTESPSQIIHIEKSGYLYKWQDRSIGWTGTKWDLRFVRLARGRLSYYRTHNDNSPRYILTLRNCAVRDDGFKQNGRYWKRNNSNGSNGSNDIDLHTPGAYYHVFSIYQRPEKEEEDETDDDIVPLLRFSTQSFAEKSLWMEQLSDACAFCDTDEFVKLEEQHAAELVAAEQRNANIINQTFSSAAAYKNGTLPPMFFAPAPPPKIRRNPSNATLKKASRRASYLKLNTSKDAPKSNTQRKSGYPPSKPMHRSASPSYLSDEAPMQNYRGILNLGLIILIISNFRILLSTFKDHGFVVMDWVKFLENASSTFWKAEKMVDFPMLSGLGLLFLNVTYAYGIEKSISKNVFAEWFGILLHFVNINAALIVPTMIVWYQMDSIVNGVALVMCSVILWMKLISYAHANSDYRNHPERILNTSDFIQDVDDDSLAVKYPE